MLEPKIEIRETNPAVTGATLALSIEIRKSSRLPNLVPFRQYLAFSLFRQAGFQLLLALFR